MKFLQNILLLISCLAYVPIRGRATRVVRPPKVVCIVQVAQLGDMVCTTPMFRAIKQAYPDAQVFVVGKPLNGELLRGNSDVDRYVVWDGRPFALARAIRRLKCDFAVTTSPNFEGLVALFLAGVPSIAVPRVEGGYTPLETRAYRILRRFARAVPHAFNAYAPREYLRLLEPAGIVSDDTRKHLRYSPEAERSALQKLHGSAIGTRAFAVIAPGAGHPAKRWPPSRFALVAEHIAAKHMPVAVIGGSADRKDVAAVMAHVSGNEIVNFGERFSIEELKAFIAKASLFISGDTGPLYIAEAFDVPTIDIVGPASDTSQPPRGPHNIVIAPTRDKPAMTIFSTQGIDPVETKRQAEATQVSEVTAAVDALIIKTLAR